MLNALNKIASIILKLSIAAILISFLIPDARAEVNTEMFKLDNSGAKFIEKHEGNRADVYLDTAGLPTVGIGHLLTPYERKRWKVGTIVSASHRDTLFRQDIQWAEEYVNKRVKVEMNQEIFNSLVSFVFNVGSGNFRSSTLLKKLNKGDYVGASREFDKWVYSGGKYTAGLKNRRDEEEGLFLQGLAKMQIRNF